MSRVWLQRASCVPYTGVTPPPRAPSSGRPARAQDNRTALAVAAVNGQTEAVKLLLQAGANPNLASSSGVTPLLEACR